MSRKRRWCVLAVLCTSLGPGGLWRRECIEPGAECRAQAVMTTALQELSEIMYRGQSRDGKMGSRSLGDVVLQGGLEASVNSRQKGLLLGKNI